MICSNALFRRAARLFPAIAVVGLACVATLPPRVCVLGAGGIIDVCAPGPSDSAFCAPQGWCSADTASAGVPAVNFREAALAARLSWLSYLCNDSLKQLGTVWIDSVGSLPVPYLAGNKACIWFDSAGGRVWIIIRGTFSVENVIQDFDYPKAYDPIIGAWVHRGFLQATERLEPLIRSKIAAHARLYITGHSLGGAVALLLAIHLQRAGFFLGPVYTFGQPKVLAESTVVAYRCLPVIRFVNDDDPVPFIPPTLPAPSNPADSLHPSWHGIYRHLGDEVVLHLPDGYDYSLTHNEFRNGYLYAATIWKNLKSKDYKKLLPDHLPNEYARRVALLAGIR